MGDDAKLYNGRWVDGPAVRLFSDSAHPRLFRLFSNRKLVFDVFATCGHLLYSHVLVGHAVLRGACRRCAGAAIVRFGHDAARLGCKRSVATVGRTHDDLRRGWGHMADAIKLLETSRMTLPLLLEAQSEGE